MASAAPRLLPRVACRWSGWCAGALDATPATYTLTLLLLALPANAQSALAGEQYTEAAELRDRGLVGLAGWWAGKDGPEDFQVRRGWGGLGGVRVCFVKGPSGRVPGLGGMAEAMEGGRACIFQAVADALGGRLENTGCECAGLRVCKRGRWAVCRKLWNLCEYRNQAEHSGHTQQRARTHPSSLARTRP